MRWLVERPNRVAGTSFEDVGAEHLTIHYGALMFKDDPFEQPTYIIAAGQWLTVIPAADEAGA